MANTKIVYGTILPDISSEETIMVILLRAVLETLKIRTTGSQRHQYRVGIEPFRKSL
ncbi:MAG: hypothetical protein WA220_07650 [Candidatus Nitrosopolaris sp.]